MFTFLAMTWSVNKLQYSQSVNVNLVQSLAINLPHTLRCNLTIDNNCLQNFSHSLHQNTPPEHPLC